jgi:Thiamine pyrophosphate enzyme, central domain
LQSEVRGRSRSPGADAVLAIGFRFWSGEKFGEAPTWSESARYIQADATPTRIGLHVPAEVAMVGDAKLVLRQLCDAARANDWKRAGQSDWLQEVAEVRTNFDRVIIEQEHKHHDGIPIHPAGVARELCEVIDPRTCLRASRWASRRRECQPLQIQVTLSVIGRGKVKGCLQIAVSIRGLGRTSTLVADCRLLNHTPIVQPLPTSYPLRRDPHRIGLQLEDEVLNCWSLRRPISGLICLSGLPSVGLGCFAAGTRKNLV